MTNNQSPWLVRFADIATMLKACSACVAARDGTELIGFGRAMSDGKYRALIDDIVVAETHRRAGIGAAMVGALQKELAGVQEVFLNTEHRLCGFYEKLGFRPFSKNSTALGSLGYRAQWLTLGYLVILSLDHSMIRGSLSRGKNARIPRLPQVVFAVVHFYHMGRVTFKSLNPKFLEKIAAGWSLAKSRAGHGLNFKNSGKIR